MGNFVCESDTPEWLEARNSGIGASEAPAALGVSRWSQPRELYHRKRGEMLAFEGNDATRMGHLMEPVVAQLFTDATGMKVRQGVGMWRHSEWGFMLATPDGAAEDGQGLELKTTMSYAAGKDLGESGSDEIPSDWLLQASQQIAVCDLQRVYFGVLILDKREFRWFQVERDDDLIESIADGEGELWQRILDGDPPPEDFEHESTWGLLQSRYPDIDESNIVSLSTTASQLWQKAGLIGHQIKQLEQVRKELQARVYAEIGDAAAGTLPGGEKMIRRKLMEESTYTATRKARVDFREVKVPKPKKARKAVAK